MKYIMKCINYYEDTHIIDFKNLTKEIVIM